MKTACVLQGPIHKETSLILQEMAKRFDIVVLSTWESEQIDVSLENLHIIKNARPPVAGANNRNLQRLTTANGIKRAYELGVDYILKARTDMLLTELDIKAMTQDIECDVPRGMKSRILIPSFRCLTVKPDWFSSIPDLFAFGSIETMTLLWGDQNFDYTLEANIPARMREEITFSISEILPSRYGPESELYALFREALEKRTGKSLSHKQMLFEYFSLRDHSKFHICWFGKDGFRTINSAPQIRWWTEADWKNRLDPIVYPIDYPVRGWVNKLRQRLFPLYRRLDQKIQSRRFQNIDVQSI